MKRQGGNKPNADHDGSVIAMEMDDLDMEIKDLRLQKIALTTSGINQSTKNLEFYATERKDDLSLPIHSFAVSSLLRDMSPTLLPKKPRCDQLMTETKPIEVARRSKIQQLLGKPRRATPLTMKSNSHEEDYQSVNCTFVGSPKEGLQPASIISSTAIKPFSQSLLVE